METTKTESQHFRHGSDMDIKCSMTVRDGLRSVYAILESLGYTQ